MGIMASFSVAKKINESEVRAYFDKQKKSGKKDEEIGTLLQNKIIKEIADAISKDKVPGLISVEEIAKQHGISKKVVSNMPELNRLIMIITHKISEKNYDKMSLCYFINSLVNLLSLTEEDFEKFHAENSDDDDDDDDAEKA